MDFPGADCYVTCLPLQIDCQSIDIWLIIIVGLALKLTTPFLISQNLSPSLFEEEVLCNGQALENSNDSGTYIEAQTCHIEEHNSKDFRTSCEAQSQAHFQSFPHYGGGDNNDDDSDASDTKLSFIEHLILPGIILGIFHTIWRVILTRIQWGRY